MDNSGAAFPVGAGYGVHAVIHAGEYHFPLLDAENSTSGGPNVTLLNHANPSGVAYTVGFYDDRGYRTLSGYNVTKSSTGGSGSTADVGAALGGINPPATINANPVNGFNMSSSQRSYGQTGNNGNTNVPNTGSFSDTKGLDLWTYFPSPAATSMQHVQASSGIKPSDELEYTIYFLDTQGPATSVTLGDVLPGGTTFEANAFTAVSGIGLALNASTLPTTPSSFLTNAADADAGTFYAPGAVVPPAADPSGTPNMAGGRRRHARAQPRHAARREGAWHPDRLLRVRPVQGPRELEAARKGASSDAPSVSPPNSFSMQGTQAPAVNSPRRRNTDV